MTPQSSPPRPPRARKGLWWLGAALLLLLVLVAYAAWTATTAARALDDARGEGRLLAASVKDRDAASSRTHLRAVQEDFASAHDATDGPVWALAVHLPVVGPDVEAVRTLSKVGDQLADGTLDELVPAVAGDLLERLTPHDGRIDTAAITEAAPLLARARLDLEQAETDLGGVDSTSLGGRVKPGFRSFAGNVRDLSSAMSTADRAARVLPGMLGQDEPRTYLLMFDNNAEVRSTGGLPGAYAVLRTENGRLRLVRQGAGSDFGEAPSPVLRLSAAEKELYGPQLGTYFRDTNFTPDFPRTAALVRAMWQRRAGERLDGVLSMDTVTLSYLLGGTGPVTGPGGLRLDAGNVVDELLSKVYFRLSDPEAQDVFFARVAKTIFRTTTAGAGSPTELLSGLSRAASEGRVYVHSFRADEQRVLRGSQVAGEMTSEDKTRPDVDVTFNDATGSKMSYYLRSRSRVRSTACDGTGQQQLVGDVDVTYTAKSPPVAELPAYVTGGGEYGTPVGQQLVLVRVYGSTGGEITDLRVDGKPYDPETVEERGRPVLTAVVQLERGQTVRVSWRMLTAAGQDAPARLHVTPGLERRAATTAIPTACAS